MGWDVTVVTAFIDLLGRVRVGAASTTSTGLAALSDIDVLNEHILSKLLKTSPVEFTSFADAPVVFGERQL